MKLIKDLKDLKKNRKNWVIKPSVKAVMDTDDYITCLFPTIVFQPWIYRSPNSYVVELWWLNFYVGFVRWERRNDDAER